MMITASDFSGGIQAIPSDTINIPGPESKYDGVNTALAASKLTASGVQGGFLQTLDSSGRVINQGVQVGDVVYNTTTANLRVAYVTSVDSALTLSLSADIFPVTDPVVLNSYRIYSGNGVNLSTFWGWKLLAGANLQSNAGDNDTLNYNNGGPTAVVPSGGTYLGDATFNITIADGSVATVAVNVTDTAFSEVDLIGQTIIFAPTELNAAFGAGTGTGSITLTIGAADITFAPEILDVGNAKPFQLYCGGAASDIYVTTIDGDFVFFEDVPIGTILPVVVCRVNVGSAPTAGNGQTNTLTTAAGRFVALN